jgi:hypothetical protein
MDAGANPQDSELIDTPIVVGTGRKKRVIMIFTRPGIECAQV